jgi:hypothetical protein
MIITQLASQCFLVYKRYGLYNYKLFWLAMKEDSMVAVLHIGRKIEMRERNWEDELW